MKAVEEGRKKFDSIHNSPDEAYIPIDEEVLIAAADQKEIYNKSRVKSDKHTETQDKKPVKNEKSLDTKVSTSVNVKQDATEKKDSTRVNLSEGTKVSASISSSSTQKNALSVGNEKIDALTIEKKEVVKIQPKRKRAKKSSGFLANLIAGANQTARLGRGPARIRK